MKDVWGVSTFAELTPRSSMTLDQYSLDIDKLEYIWYMNAWTHLNSFDFYTYRSEKICLCRYRRRISLLLSLRSKIHQAYEAKREKLGLEKWNWFEIIIWIPAVDSELYKLISFCTTKLLTYISQPANAFIVGRLNKYILYLEFDTAN